MRAFYANPLEKLLVSVRSNSVYLPMPVGDRIRNRFSSLSQNTGTRGWALLELGWKELGKAPVPSIPRIAGHDQWQTVRSDRRRLATA